MIGTRPTVAASTNRWASRSSSQRLRRDWTPPDLRVFPPQPDTMSLYSSPDYILGNSSMSAMSYSASRLSHNSSVRSPPIPEKYVPPIVQTEPAEIDGVSVEVYEMPG